ncbi:hypothetical protein BH23BAC1_BH23BAC1_31070 [soil metagenome]
MTFKFRLQFYFTFLCSLISFQVLSQDPSIKFGKIDESELTMIYDYVKGAMTWNGKNKLYTEKNLKKAFEEKVGNSAEIIL